MSDTPQPVFSIEKVYVKDLSLETPNSPQCFLEREAPQVEVSLGTSAVGIGEGSFETQLTVTVTAKIADKTQFLIEVVQAGIFTVQNVPQQDLEPVLLVACPNILFPFAREAVSDAIGRAGFPPVLLAPVNFEMMYRQKLDQQAPAQAPHEVPIQ